MVPAGEHDRRARVGQAGQRLVEQGHHLDPRQGAVVDVTRDHDGVHGLGPHHLDEVVDHRGLGVQHADPMERATEVPVGGVEDPHGPDSRKVPRSSVGAAPGLWTT